MTEELLLARIEDYLATETSAEKERAVSAVAEYLYLNLARYRLDSPDEDMRGDFILWLYPKLGKIVALFNPERSSFKTYLGWMVKLSYRTFRRAQYSLEARQRVLECEEASRLTSAEPESLYTGGDTGTDTGVSASVGVNVGDAAEKVHSPKKSSAFSRKIFLLACKSSAFLDEQSIFKVISLTGYDEGYVRTQLEYIRRSCLDKQERMRSSREKQYAYYIRAQRCRYEMKYLDQGCKRYIDLEREYRYCTKRLDAVRKTAARHIQAPSNRFLARTLGICRGTIDSTLASAVRDGYSDIS